MRRATRKGGSARQLTILAGVVDQWMAGVGALGVGHQADEERVIADRVRVDQPAVEPGQAVVEDRQAARRRRSAAIVEERVLARPPAGEAIRERLLALVEDV